MTTEQTWFDTRGLCAADVAASQALKKLNSLYLFWDRIYPETTRTYPT
jgi:ribosomal protein L16/L10AE